MTDTKSQQHRSAPSGPLSDKKYTIAVGGNGTTILANTNTNITLTDAKFAKVKKNDVILVAPEAVSGPGDANVRPICAYCSTDGEVTVSFNNPTAANVINFTCSVNLLVFPFNL